MRKKIIQIKYVQLNPSKKGSLLMAKTKKKVKKKPKDEKLNKKNKVKK